MNILSKSNKPLNAKLLGLDRLNNNSYVAITNGIEITVWPEFIDSQTSSIANIFIWSYHVRIDNHSNESIKLLNRHWRIIDEYGVIQEVDGSGVIGEQPKIAAGNNFQYSSGVHLRHPSGIMSGYYQLQKDNGDLFNANIPAFSLDVPSIKNVIN